MQHRSGGAFMQTTNDTDLAFISPRSNAGEEDTPYDPTWGSGSRPPIDQSPSPDGVCENCCC